MQQITSDYYYEKRSINKTHEYMYFTTHTTVMLRENNNKLTLKVIFFNVYKRLDQ